MTLKEESDMILHIALMRIGSIASAVLMGKF